MRKAQKEQVEELLKLLEQAHEEIKRNIEKRNFEPVLVTLADCQDCAVAMGNLIEESEGENFVTISFLEKYCEAVYQIYQSIANGENIDANKTDKSLRKTLIAAENSIRNDIKIRKEVVFFPYKASMWDSLESVYLAAKADPDCDAYCVPIPYFDKNPDGTVKEMHYEGREYPANIEIIDWQSYNFEERKPDAIYIHNPYDQFNYVTSVHPRFYASNLQKYTNELVYIPYFVLDEIDPDDQAGIESMKHFCYLPGTIYADKVILQSENMRQIYIKEYMKACKKMDDQNLREELEKRFLGLGSPKFDKVLNTKKEDLEIPTEWLEIIEKPDGCWKKIIFYNTSINALLQHDEKMLEKMKDVFRVFKEKLDEIVLLWRPHPLIQATIESMRPQLWAQYKEIVEQYKAEGWGIYDDSADLDRAVVLSDAYYGDPSSVIVLVRKREKRVLLQDVYCSNNTDTIAAVSECCIEVCDAIYASSYGFNGIIRFNTVDNSFSYLASFPGYSLWEERLYSEVVKCGDMLVFIPLMASHIAVYSLSQNIVKMYELMNDKIENKFIGGILYDDFILAIPYMYSSFVKFYPASGKVEYILPMSDILSKKKDNKPYFQYHYLYEKEKIYLPILECNKMLIIDVSTMKCVFFDIDQVKSSITGITIINDDMWLLESDSGLIYKFDTTSNKCTTICILDERDSRNFNYECINYGRYIIVLPIGAGEIKYIDTETNEVRKLDFLTMICNRNSARFGSKWIQICGFFFCSKELYIFDNYDFALYKIVMAEDGLSIMFVCNSRMSRGNIIGMYKTFTSERMISKNLNGSNFETSFYGLEEFLDELDENEGSI